MPNSTDTTCYCLPHSYRLYDEICCFLAWPNCRLIAGQAKKELISTSKERETNPEEIHATTHIEALCWVFSSIYCVFAKEFWVPGWWLCLRQLCADPQGYPGHAEVKNITEIGANAEAPGYNMRVNQHRRSNDTRDPVIKVRIRMANFDGLFIPFDHFMHTKSTPRESFVQPAKAPDRMNHTEQKRKPFNGSNGFAQPSLKAKQRHTGV
ncbi:hypothetical protein B0H13DRAFT_1896278 [Mycena leptocephala]|nr:hypothetical protein B0H13DRAFT_1896278 [Mycena leptocephala]